MLGMRRAKPAPLQTQLIDDALKMTRRKTSPLL
jgi:hypothetical protein